MRNKKTGGSVDEMISAESNTGQERCGNGVHKTALRATSNGSHLAVVHVYIYGMVLDSVRPVEVPEILASVQSR